MQLRHLSLAALLSLAARVSAGANSSDVPTYTDIASALLQFKDAMLVPQLIPEELMSLSAVMHVNYPSNSSSDSTGANMTEAILGSTMPVEAVQKTPTFTLDYTQPVDEQQIFWSSLFTLMVFDAGYPVADGANMTDSSSSNNNNSSSAAAAPAQVQRHFLANNLTVVDGVLMNFTRPVTSYIPPSAQAGEGPHRIVSLLFAQNDDFAVVPASNGTALNVTNAIALPGQAQDFKNSTALSLTDYVAQAKLGKIVAASYYIVQNGTQLSETVQKFAALPTAAPDASQVQAMATSVSASIIAEGTQAKWIKESSAAVSTALTTPVAAIAAAAVLGATVLFA